MSIGKRTKTIIKNEILDLETRIQENKKEIERLEYSLKQYKHRLSRQQESLMRKKRELLYIEDKRRKNLL